LKLFVVKFGMFSNKGMGNINGVPGKTRQFGTIIDSHLSRKEYFVQMV